MRLNQTPSIELLCSIEVGPPPQVGVGWTRYTYFSWSFPWSHPSFWPSPIQQLGSHLGGLEEESKEILEVASDADPKMAAVEKTKVN